MTRQTHFYANIIGDEWQVKYVTALESLNAKNEGREIVDALSGKGSEELVYRACCLAKCVFYDGEKVFADGREVLENLTESEIFELTEGSYVQKEPEYREAPEAKVDNYEAALVKPISDSGKAYKSYGESNSQLQTKTADGRNSSQVQDVYTHTGGYKAANDTVGYRDRVVALSRYLERDSRRFDGITEIY